MQDFSHTDLALGGQRSQWDYRIGITEPARINSISEMQRTAAGMLDKFSQPGRAPEE